MGMTCSLWRVPATDAQRLKDATSSEIERFLFGERAAAPPRESGLVGWLKSLSPIRIEEPVPVDDEQSPESAARAGLDIDKAWHGLQFLFTRSAWEGAEPACFLVTGGEEIGDDELGDSLPRVLHPAQVQAFAEFLSQLSREALALRYDPSVMMRLEIYPEIWDREGEQGLEYLLDYFDTLRDFVHGAAAEREALIVAVS